MYTREKIEAMAATIVEAVRPMLIILFGSHARGDTSSGSDVDLLIIEDTDFEGGRSRWKEISTIRKALRPFRGAKDILVYSKSEADLLHDSPNHVIGEAFREGEVLYEA